LAYAEEADLLNVALFNCTAKDWREANPDLVKKSMNIRDTASINELAILSNLETLNAEMIKENISKKDRFYKLREITQPGQNHKSTIENGVSTQHLLQINGEKITAEKSSKLSNKTVQNHLLNYLSNYTTSTTTSKQTITATNTKSNNTSTDNYSPSTKQKTYPTSKSSHYL